MKGELMFVSLQVDARLVAEIEAFAEKKEIDSTEQALLKALEEFFREHGDCKAA